MSRHDVDEAASRVAWKVLLQHSCAAEVLAWGKAILASGPDRKVTAVLLQQLTSAFKGARVRNVAYVQVAVYCEDGTLLHAGYFASDGACAAAAANANGTVFVLGGSERMQVFYADEDVWRESAIKQVCSHGPYHPVYKVLLTSVLTLALCACLCMQDFAVSALAWNPRSSTIAVGTLHGSVELHHTFLKRVSYGDAFEITFLTGSQADVRNVQTGEASMLEVMASFCA
jgi:hypothetical protein